MAKVNCVFSIVNQIRCYDNGGKSFDRYTVVYLNEPYTNDETDKRYHARGMSEKPSAPMGVGMMTSAMCGIHLGRRIDFKSLPLDCQRIVKKDLGLR